MLFRSSPNGCIRTPSYNPKKTVVYEGGGSGSGIRRTLENSIDFGLTERFPSDEDYELFPKLITIPYVGATVILIFNNPTIEEYLNSLPINETIGTRNYTPQNYLILGRETVAGIYGGEINYWDDPRILADNTPGLGEVGGGSLFEHIPIFRFTRRDASGTTTLFMDALGSFSESFGDDYPASSRFPSNLTSLPDFFTAFGNDGLAHASFNLEYSIAYISSPSNLNMEFALIPNFRGQLTSPLNDNPALTGLLDNEVPVVNEKNEIDGIDLDRDQIYPIFGFSYLLINPEIAVSCEGRREAFLFLRYSLSDSKIRQIGESLVFLLPSQNYDEEALKILETVTCGEGIFLLDPVMEEIHESAAFPVFLSLAMFFLVVTITSSAYFMFTQPGTRKASILPFSVLLLCGGFLCYFVQIFWYLVPDEDYICQLRQWLTAFGLTFVVIAMALRQWVLLQIFLRRKHFTSYTTSIRDALIFMCIAILIQLIIMLCWTEIDPYSSSKRSEDNLNQIFSWECRSEDSWIWFGLEIAFFAIMISFMMITVYFVWKFSADLPGHKYTVMSIYNLVMIFIVLAILYTTTIEGDDEVAITAMVSLTVVTLSSVGLNFQLTAATQATATARSRSQSGVDKGSK